VALRPSRTLPAQATGVRGEGATGWRSAPPVARSIRVLIANHCPPTRAGVRLAVEAHGCLVCAETGDADAAVEAARVERPDVCLIDRDLPGDPIRAVSAIADDLPDTAVVMFGDTLDDAEVFAALVAGACGYLPKSTEPDRLCIALQRTAEGEAALPRASVRKMIEELRERERRRRLPRFRELTSREFEVLDLLGQDLSTAQIAERLYVAKVTVRTHVASILRKLGVPDRQAAISALRRR